MDKPVMSKPVTSPFSFISYFRNLTDGLKGSAVGTIAPKTYHGSLSMSGRIKHAGERRAQGRRNAYRSHMRSLRG